MGNFAGRKKSDTVHPSLKGHMPPPACAKRKDDDATTAPALATRGTTFALMW